MTATLARCAGPFLAALAATALAATDPRDALFDGVDGATCRFFNAGAQVPWQQPLGDWTDAAGVVYGGDAFASATLVAGPAPAAVTWDVTRLVRSWLAPGAPPPGVLLAPLLPQGRAEFASRESPLVEYRPRLAVTIAGTADRITLAPLADTTLDCSTRRSRGLQPVLQIGASLHGALQFDLAPLTGLRIARASLELTTTSAVTQAVTVGVFQLGTPRPLPRPFDHPDLALRYPNDRGIERDPDVWLATDFEAADWRAAWTYVSPVSRAERVPLPEGERALPASGHALRVRVPKGANLGLDMGFDFAAKLGYEPEEVFLRYYLRLADDWVPTVDGGKLPGLSATYGKAGWGGRRTDGRSGWSMRGHFNRAPSAANPLHGRTTVGTYAYHADMEEEYGDLWSWTRGGAGILERERWYCLEQRVKLNTPGEHDGIVQAWVDGAVALDKREVRLRVAPTLRVERVWMNVYHGGTAPADRDMHLYLANVVVARTPIGCGHR